MWLQMLIAQLGEASQEANLRSEGDHNTIQRDRTIILLLTIFHKPGQENRHLAFLERSPDGPITFASASK
jgi:hypothetical protein